MLISCHCNWYGMGYLIIWNVDFYEQECDEMIKTTEKQGYCKALVNVGGGRYGILIRLITIFGKSLELENKVKVGGLTS